MYAVGGTWDGGQPAHTEAKVEKLTNSGWQVVEFSHWNAIDGFNSFEPFVVNFGLVALE